MEIIDNAVWTDAECWAHNMSLEELERGAAAPHDHLNRVDRCLLHTVCKEALEIKRLMI